jgi:hypothetical protein
VVVCKGILKSGVSIAIIIFQQFIHQADGGVFSVGRLLLAY